jgi:hypothetical protein
MTILEQCIITTISWCENVARGLSTLDAKRPQRERASQLVWTYSERVRRQFKHKIYSYSFDKSIAPPSSSPTLNDAKFIAPTAMF